MQRARLYSVFTNPKGELSSCPVSDGDMKGCREVLGGLLKPYDFCLLSAAVSVALPTRKGDAVRGRNNAQH